MVDIDPGFTQFWHAAGARGRERRGPRRLLHDRRADRHPDDCPIPTGGIDWRPGSPAGGARGLAGRRDAGEGDRFTTIATWRGPFGPVEHGGRTLRPQGARVPQVRRAAAALAAAVRDRPRHHPADAARPSTPCGSTAGDSPIPAWWPATRTRCAPTCRDPAPSSRRPRGCTSTPPAAGSAIARVRYLASGKPVLVQDTGFSETLPVGEGPAGFTNIEEASRAPRRSPSATRSTQRRLAGSPSSTSTPIASWPGSASGPASNELGRAPPVPARVTLGSTPRAISTGAVRGCRCTH